MTLNKSLVSANTTLTTSHEVVIVDASSNNVEITLPDGTTANNRWCFRVYCAKSRGGLAFVLRWQ